MTIKSLTRGNFEHFWSILTKIRTCGSPICPLDRCVIFYDVFKTICGTKEPFVKLEVLSADPDIAVKSLARGNFEHFHRNKYPPISPLDHCVVL